MNDMNNPLGQSRTYQCVDCLAKIDWDDHMNNFGMCAPCARDRNGVEYETEQCTQERHRHE